MSLRNERPVHLFQTKMLCSTGKERCRDLAFDVSRGIERFLKCSLKKLPITLELIRYTIR